MDDPLLFAGVGAERAVNQTPVADEPPRLRRPDRRQVLLQPCCLEDLLPPEHEFRTLWAVVAKLDLSAFYAPLRCRGSSPGRGATDPQLLVGLWLAGATCGVGQARALARLCEHDERFKWMCGGVSVNHHTLGDFRVGHAGALDALFTSVLALLMAEGLVHVDRITQDGLRVRAAAGHGSFKRAGKLEAALDEAKAQVAALAEQGRREQEQARGQDPADENSERSRLRSDRQRAAQERAARERQERIERAMAQMPELEKIKQNRRNKEPRSAARASTTDGDARVMKMPDGGFRPACNVQIAADTASRAILAVSVSNKGTDQPHSQPLRKQVQARTGRSAREHLMDGGFVKLEAITESEAAGAAVYAPPKETKFRKKRSDTRADPYTPVAGDTPEVIAWRTRMAGPEAQAIYRQRAATSETINADLRCFRGLVQLTVRGLDKALSVVLWSALAYNLMHFGASLLRRMTT